MVKVEWLYTNYFANYDQPAWIMVDTAGQTVRLKIYDSVGSYVDDTLSGTNRTGQFMLRVWTTNPRGNISNLITDILHIDVYDTSNRLIDKKTLSYVYGRYVKQITFYYPDGFTATPLVVWGGDFNGIPVFGQITTSTVALPVTSGLIEAYVYSAIRGGKFYFIGRIEKVTDRITLIGPGERYDVTLRIRVTRDVLSFLFNIPGFEHVAGFIDYFFAQFVARPMSFAYSLVTAIMNRIGITLPAKKIDVDGTDILVTYEQDIALEVAVFFALVGLVGLYYLTQIVHDISVTMTAQAEAEKAKAIAQTYENVVKQQENTLKTALEYASQIQDPVERDKAISQILSSPLVNPSNYTSGLGTALQQANTQSQQLQQQMDQMKTMMYIAVGVAIVALILSIKR